MRNTDLGIVLYAVHSGDSASFTKANATAGTTKTLTNANYIVSDTILDAGMAGALVFTITGTISVGMASAVVIVEAQRSDANNPTVPKWCVIPTVRSDDPTAAPAASQTITRAQLAGQSVDTGSGAATEVLGVRLATTDHVLAQNVRVLVKASNAPQANDKIIVSGDAGGAL